MGKENLCSLRERKIAFRKSTLFYRILTIVRLHNQAYNFSVVLNYWTHSTDNCFYTVVCTSAFHSIHAYIYIYILRNGMHKNVPQIPRMKILIKLIVKARCVKLHPPCYRNSRDKTTAYFFSKTSIVKRW